MGDLYEELYNVILEKRKSSKPDKSYVAKISSKGKNKIAQKVGEEAVEAVIAAVNEGKKELVAESADLLFHLLILWAERGVKPSDVKKELKKRMGTSGLDEKAARKLK